MLTYITPLIVLQTEIEGVLIFNAEELLKNYN